MTHTAKLVDARDRIKALAGKRRDAARRMHNMDQHAAALARRTEADAMDVAIRVIEDILQE